MKLLIHRALVCLCSGLLMLSVEAHADIDQAKKIYGEATQAYKLGRFQEAADLYKKAYEEEKIPAFLFNIAQANFQAKQYEQAIFFYKAYLRDVADPPNLDMVTRRIEMAEAAIAEEDAAARRTAAEERLRLERERLEKETEASKARAQAEAAEQARAEAETKRATEERARSETEKQVEEQRRLAAEAGQHQAEHERLAAEADLRRAEVEAEPVYSRIWFWPTVVAVSAGAVVAVASGAALAAGGTWVATGSLRDTVPQMDLRE